MRMEATPYLVLHSVEEVAGCCGAQDNGPHHSAWNSPGKVEIVNIFCNRLSILSPEDAAEGTRHASSSIGSGIGE